MTQATETYKKDILKDFEECGYFTARGEVLAARMDLTATWLATRAPLEECQLLPDGLGLGRRVGHYADVSAQVEMDNAQAWTALYNAIMGYMQGAPGTVIRMPTVREWVQGTGCTTRTAEAWRYGQRCPTIKMLATFLRARPEFCAEHIVLTLGER